jgi:hypothetical protein
MATRVLIKNKYIWTYLWHYSERIHCLGYFARLCFVSKAYTTPCAFILYSAANKFCTVFSL